MPLRQPRYVTDVPTTFVTDGRCLLEDPFRLEYAVFDISDSAKRAVPVQVFPSSGRGAAVKVSRGYYKAPYTPGGSEALGRREVRWYCKLLEGDDEEVWTTPWEKVSTRLEGRRYAMVCDLRDEGFTVQQLPELRAQELLARAASTLETFTGRAFMPTPKLLSLHGKGRKLLQLPEELVAVDELYLGLRNEEEAVPREEIIGANRHLTERLVRPDDRNNPKVELACGSFPCNRHNVWLMGVFGYTEADGSPMGRTPEVVKRLSIMLVDRELGLIGGDTREDSRRWVVEERTEDQSVTFANPSMGNVKIGTPLLGAFTGDPDIDTLVASLVKPGGLGSA